MGSKPLFSGIQEERTPTIVATAATPSAPASGSQATITVAAADTGVRHVVNSFSFSLTASAFTVATTITCAVIDGSSGGSTYLFEETLHIGSSGITPIRMTDLHLAGSKATALTIEFDRGVTNCLESVNLGYYDIGP